ncbi:MAG: hypothetical protein GY801_06645 [bacterium]|nr:hypothetical protein [bacterium]
MSIEAPYLPYSKYKLSGLYWLGEVPEHWEIYPLTKYSESIVDYRGRTPEKVKQGIFLVTAKNIKSGVIDYEVSKEYISQESYAEILKRGRPRRGDILFTTEAPLGQIAVVDNENIALAQRIIKFRLSPDLFDISFVKYALQSSDFQKFLQSLATGSTALGIKASKLHQLKFAAPPSISEQNAIADFLDRETATIDELIAAKERLIGLLAEKRRALITQAVTRGLNPATPLKDSGVEWLGQIPEHWQVEFAQWLFKQVDNRSTTGEEELLTVSHLTGVTSRSKKDVNMFMAESMEGYKICSPGDLAINTLWAWMGAMGVAFQRGIISPSYHVYRSVGLHEPRYIDYLVRMPIFAQEVIRYSKGVWSSRLRLYPDEFFKLLLPVPPLEEQKAIADYLTLEIRRIDNLNVAAQKTINLLHERRAALIAAAVSGRIHIKG